MHEIATIAEQRLSRLADEAAAERLARRLREGTERPAGRRVQARWATLAARFRVGRLEGDAPPQI